MVVVDIFQKRDNNPIEMFDDSHFTPKQINNISYTTSLTFYRN